VPFDASHPTSPRCRCCRNPAAPGTAGWFARSARAIRRRRRSIDGDPLVSVSGAGARTHMSGPGAPRPRTALRPCPLMSGYPSLGAAPGALVPCAGPAGYPLRVSSSPRSHQPLLGSTSCHSPGLSSWVHLPRGHFRGAFPRSAPGGSARGCPPRRRFPALPFPDAPLPGLPHARVPLGLAVPPRGGSRPRGCPGTPVRARRCRRLVARWGLALAANQDGPSWSSMLQALSPPRAPRAPHARRVRAGLPTVRPGRAVLDSRDSRGPGPEPRGPGERRGRDRCVQRLGEVSRGTAAARLSTVAVASAARSRGVSSWRSVSRSYPGMVSPGARPARGDTRLLGEALPAGGVSRQRPFARRRRRVCPLALTAPSCSLRSSWIPAAPRRTLPHRRDGGGPRRHSTGGGGRSSGGVRGRAGAPVALRRSPGGAGERGSGGAAERRSGGDARGCSPGSAPAGPPGRRSFRRATAHPGRSRAHRRAGGVPLRPRVDRGAL